MKKLLALVLAVLLATPVYATPIDDANTAIQGNIVSNGVGRITAPVLNTVFTSVMAAVSYVAGLVQTFNAGTYISPLSYGAKCDGTTNDSAAINLALNAFRGGTVLLPNASCYAATGVTIPTGAVLKGTSFNAHDPTLYTGGSRLLCPNNITSPCVSLGAGDQSGQTARLEGVVVQGIGSSAPSSGIGVKVDGVFSAALVDVMSYNFNQGFYWKAYNQNGLGSMATRLYTGRISDAHMVVDSWPELKITQSRFGVDGTADLGAQTYVRFQSANYANNAAGANTFDCVECQFNEGNGGHAVTHGVEFVSLGSGGFPTHDVEIFRFDHSHIENVTAGFYSDGTWNTIVSLALTNSYLVTTTSTGPMFAFNSATNVREMRISNDRLLASVGIVAGLTGANSLDNSFDHNFINGNVVADNTANGSGGHIDFSNNTIAGSFTLTGGSWYSIDLSHNAYIGGRTIAPAALTTSTINISDSGNANIQAGVPEQYLANLSAASGSRLWHVVVDNNGAYRIQTCNDTGSCNDALLVEHNGSSVDTLIAGAISVSARTVSTLPTCSSANKYYHYNVGDATTAVYYSIVAGGGLIPIGVTCDGAGNWREF